MHTIIKVIKILVVMIALLLIAGWLLTAGLGYAIQFEDRLFPPIYTEHVSS